MPFRKSSSAVLPLTFNILGKPFLVTIRKLEVKSRVSGKLQKLVGFRRGLHKS